MSTVRVWVHIIKSGPVSFVCPWQHTIVKCVLLW